MDINEIKKGIEFVGKKGQELGAEVKKDKLVIEKD